MNIINGVSPYTQQVREVFRQFPWNWKRLRFRIAEGK